MAVDTKTLSPFGLGPQDAPIPAHQVLRSGEGTITMVFPRKVIMLTDEGVRIEFNPGPQEVPAHLAQHDWLRRNGVQAYDSPIAKQAIESAKALEDAQQAFDKASADLQAATAKVALTAGKPATPEVIAKIELAGVPLDNEETPEERDARLTEEAAERAAAQAVDAPTRIAAERNVAAARQAQSNAAAKAAMSRGRR
jgi:hypothetical protein